MRVVACGTGQCTLFIQGQLDGELLFHRPHACQKLGGWFHHVVEIARVISADHVAAPAQQFHRSDQFDFLGSAFSFNRLFDMAKQTCFGLYRSLGVQLDMGIQFFIVLFVMAPEANIASAKIGITS